MTDIIKEIKIEEKQVEKSFGKANVWMILSIILAISLIAVIFWPNGISATKAGEELTAALNAKTGGGVTLKAIEDQGSLYEATVVYQGQEIPVYITKSGDYIVYQAEKTSDSGAAAADTNATDNAPAPETPTEVVKSDKPKVEAFVFAYCPYGLQFEKAFLPAYNLLKNKADMNIVFIGAMHGEYEKTESLRQLCIQKEYGKDKLMAYLDKFVVDTAIGACSSNINCSKPLAEAIMSGLNIDVDKVNDCMDEDAEALYDADGTKASSLGISGSPTFVINGAEVQVSRTADSIKKAVCDAFNTAPAECSQNLSTSSMTAGFGSSAGASTGASCG
jgi:hypothetical protein